MNKYIQIPLYFLLCLSGIAQEKTDSSASQKQELVISGFISGGMVLTQYKSAFINYLADKTFIPSSIGAQYPTPGINYQSSNFHYARPVPGYSICLGIQFIHGHIKNVSLHHFVESHYIHFSGHYSYLASYTENRGNGNYNDTDDIIDIVNADYTQTVLSLGYKVQPTYKNIFFSLGVEFDKNSISVNEQMAETQNGIRSDNHGTINYSGKYTSSATAATYFYNFPLQLGAGAKLRMKRVELRPAFYFTDCFLKDYYSYILSMDIQFNAKK
jgi:hypothetical protein